MDNYLKELDCVPFSPESIFKNEEEKEKYETQLMYVFRKYQATKYHFENIIKFLEKDDKITRTMDKFNGIEEVVSKTTVQFVESRLTIEKPANHYVYELSAFLETLKSSIDFLAAVIVKHMKGVQTDKISTLMKMVDSGKTGPIFDQVKTHYNWLQNIGEYRHHLVHRLILRMARVYKKVDIFDQTKTFLQPIVIPKFPPKFVPDTRRSRLLGNQTGYKMPYIEIKSQFDDKSIRTYFEYLPYKGYVPIKEFTENHLNSFKIFFKDIIDILTKLEFKQI